MKRFVLSDDKEGKMSSSSLQLKRWVNTSAAYSQRILERFGALHTWAKSTSMSTYHIFNYIPHIQLHTTSSTECTTISFCLLGNNQYIHSEK